MNVRERMCVSEEEAVGEGRQMSQRKVLEAEACHHLRLSSREATAGGTCWAMQGREVLNRRNLGQNYGKKIQL